jgi:signal transduction histidine kinase
MAFVFAFSLLSVCLLSAFHFWNMFFLRNEFLLSERIYDLSDDILEMRRYEKNFFFYGDAQNLGEGLGYLERIDQMTAVLTPNIQDILGQKRLDAFREDLSDYGAAIREFHGGAPVSPQQRESIRAKGKALVDFATELINTRRALIHAAIEHTLGLPFAFLAVFLLVIFLMGALLYIRVLKPLAMLRETTRRVGRGDFRPVGYNPAYHDEITELIGAFNLMANELESNQEHLVQARKMAALGTFTAGVAHELNNPINNISLTGEALLEDFAQDLAPEVRDMVGDIMSQSERAAGIVKNLLDFSRTERPAFGSLVLEKVLRETLTLIKNQIMLSGVRTEIVIADGLPSVQGDGSGLRQVFMNLMINAIQAMPKGGTLTVDAKEDPEGTVRVDIRDTGLGIEPEALEHIFEPFFTTKEVGKGTGLGLSVCYSLVKRHGGRIEVRSTPGQGTVFSVLLPATRLEEADKQ